MNRTTGFAIGLALMPLVGLAQIGKDVAQCEKIWGAPVSGKLDESGFGELNYKKAGATVSLVFYRGVAGKAVYMKPGMGKEDVDSLLALNDRGMDWNPWTPPGISSADVEGTMWLLEDDLGLAELDGNRLQVTGSAAVSRPGPTLVPETIKSKHSEPSVVGTAKKPTGSVKPPELVKPQSGAALVPMPENMPAVGDSKAAVLKMLGDPSGVMESGGKEILVYGWGNIWIADDKVVSIERATP